MSETLRPPDETAISDEDFAKFQEFFYRKTGISFSANKRYFVDKRLVERIDAAEFKNFREYFNFLRFQASGLELQALINIMTVNETYFYREAYQFKCMVNSMLPELLRRKRRGDRVRIWSIPCSTGEEPYSLALWLLENWPHVDDYDVEIVASDIDTKALAAAKMGVFGERSLQHVPYQVVQRYFQKRGGDVWVISDDLRNSIEFTQLNLNSPTECRAYSGFDMIFCRNLLIYFDDISRRRAAETFYDALIPGGFCCLGHSESMSRISSLFGIRKFPEAIVYQKPL